MVLLVVAPVCLDRVPPWNARSSLSMRGGFGPGSDGLGLGLALLLSSW